MKVIIYKYDYKKHPSNFTSLYVLYGNEFNLYYLYEKLKGAPLLLQHKLHLI